MQNTMAGMDSPHPQAEPKPVEPVPSYDAVSHGYEPLMNQSTGTNINRFESLSEGVIGRRIAAAMPPGMRLEAKFLNPDY